MSLSVLGCVVNGPGEARETDIGLTGGGAGKHMVYLAGVTDPHIEDARMVDHIVSLVDAKADQIEAANAIAEARAADYHVPAIAWAWYHLGGLCEVGLTPSRRPVT